MPEIYRRERERQVLQLLQERGASSRALGIVRPWRREMDRQNFQKKDREVVQACLTWRKGRPRAERKLSLSWSNWGFGIEPVRSAEESFCTAEPLGPGGPPYPAMFGNPDPETLDRLVERTAHCFDEREAEILEANEEELVR